MFNSLSPEIGICIPTYNRADYLRICLDSIKRQGLPYEIMQIFISDNDSKDHTEEVVNSFEDLNIIYHRQKENIGWYKNYQYLCSLVNCHYAIIICDDDWLEDGYLSRAYNHLQMNSQNVMYSASAAYHSGDNGELLWIMQPMLFELNRKSFSKTLTWTNEEFISMCAAQTPVFWGSALMRTSAFQIARLNNEEFYYSHEKVLYSKLQAFGTIHFDSEVGTHVRWHPANLTKSFSGSAREEEFRSSTRKVIELAFQQGIDVPNFWHERLKSASPKQREFLLEKLSRGFSSEEISSIFSGDGEAFKDLRNLHFVSPRSEESSSLDYSVGISRTCPVCETSNQTFKPYGIISRPGALCPTCGSLERHRLLWLYLQRRTDFFKRPQRLLDIAPMEALSCKFKNLLGINYFCIDQNSPNNMLYMDITRLELTEGSIDCFLCYQFLDASEDREAISELSRVLKPGGWGIIQVPIDAYREKALKGSSIRSHQDCLRYYCNEDQVLQYRRDLKDRLEDAGFWLLVDPFAKTLTQGDIDLYGVSKGEDIYFCLKKPGLNGDIPLGEGL